MKLELQQALFERFPLAFRKAGEFIVRPEPKNPSRPLDWPSATEPYIENDRSVIDSWGVQCDAGWLSLIKEFCEVFEAKILEHQKAGLPPEKWGRVHQIKEKFGTLHLYVGGIENDSPIWSFVLKIERRSASTCERCGAPGKMYREGYWHVACDDCEGKPFEPLEDGWDERLRALLDTRFPFDGKPLSEQQRIAQALPDGIYDEIVATINSALLSPHKTLTFNGRTIRINGERLNRPLRKKLRASGAPFIVGCLRGWPLDNIYVSALTKDGKEMMLYARHDGVEPLENMGLVEIDEPEISWGIRPGTFIFGKLAK